MNCTEDIYSMGPCRKDMSQKSNKFNWYFSLPSYNRSSIYGDLGYSQPWSHYQKQKKLQEITSKWPFLAYTCLVLFFLRNPISLQNISIRTGKTKFNWENALFLPLKTSPNFCLHLSSSKALYFNPDPLPKLPVQICEHNLWTLALLRKISVRHRHWHF